VVSGGGGGAEGAQWCWRAARRHRFHTPYQEPGADFYTRRESPQQKQAWLERQLQKLHPGCTITITITITISPPEAALPPGA
jgi:hypothetical protein